MYERNDEHLAFRPNIEEPNDHDEVFVAHWWVYDPERGY